MKTSANIEQLKIGMTDCGAKFPNYEQWIKAKNPDIQVIKLSYHLNNLEDLDKCDAVLLTGGEDIHPKFHQKTNISEHLKLCNSNFMDEKRDEFEWKVCEYIFKSNRLSVLGICRGLQVVNTFLGGTLVLDIPTSGKENHSFFWEGIDRYHEVRLLDDTELVKKVGKTLGIINSAHHQSADLVANLLKINAYSVDNVIEGLEWKDPIGKPFLMLVQWHPERMDDKDTNAFSFKIREAFMQSISKNEHN